MDRRRALKVLFATAAGAALGMSQSAGDAEAASAALPRLSPPPLPLEGNPETAVATPEDVSSARVETVQLPICRPGDRRFCRQPRRCRWVWVRRFSNRDRSIRWVRVWRCN